jgi:hypothetical protein
MRQPLIGVAVATLLRGRVNKLIERTIALERKIKQ